MSLPDEAGGLLAGKSIFYQTALRLLDLSCKQQFKSLNERTGYGLLRNRCTVRKHRHTMQKSVSPAVYTAFPDDLYSEDRRPCCVTGSTPEKPKIPVIFSGACRMGDWENIKNSVEDS
jgi:hypothetical protein